MSIQSVIHFVIAVIVIGLIFGLLNYLLDRAKLFAPYRDVGKTVLLVAGVLVLIILLLQFFVHPIIVI